MNIRIALLILLASLTSALADDKIALVQQELKDQGFYYGEITGEKNADTTAAIRRFQIRNGLQITGDLNDETTKALHSGKSSASASTTSPVAAATPAVKQRTPSPAPDTSDLRDDSNRAPQEYAAPPPRLAAPPQDRQGPRVYPGAAVPSTDGNFIGTPYENAPPEVLQNVIAKAQRRLAGRDLYRGEITGAFGPELEFSLRAYQSRVGLRPTGRLDLETLAALELLPGENERVYTPRRTFRQPPVRGEWIRP
jgi:peptidoglycan hydrolase-like protein with peptidoglycan-binding domain